MRLHADYSLVVVPAISRKEVAVTSGSGLTIYLKSTLAGVLAVATAGIGLVGLFAMIARLLGGDVRPGVELGWKTGVTAILLFALGFAWQYRRASKPAARPDKTVSGSASARRG